MSHVVKRLLLRLIPDLPVTRRLPLLGPFQFRLRRHRWMLSNRCFDGHARNLAMFRRLVRPGDVVYDIGANIGYYTRYIADQLDPSAVLAFEPMSENLQLLRRNAQFSPHASRIAVHQLALSDHDGEEPLQIDDIMGGTAVLDSVAQGQASQARRHMGLPPKSEVVPVCRLDRFIEETGSPPPSMMKIDTEGAEMAVMRGAATTLERHGPRLIVATHSPQLAREVLRFLADRGYACFGYRRGAEPEYGPLAVETASALADNNIMASRDPADLERAPGAPGRG